MEISYREALPDQDEFFRLFESTGWNQEEYHLSASELYSAIQHSWYAVSAYDGTDLVGFGRIIADGVLHALIVDLIVLPEYQGQGIGSVVLTRLIAQCNAAGIKDVQLFCATGKAGFYEKFGFAARPAAGPGMQLQR